ncbi:MAG TPA: carboxypeptidase-like regulatory domain-containing protein [Terriglobia bacterium]|nr:carboxypeptidase-like regulatory domain-containing protein [Terriglobia bacterium]HLI63520.1 carboxypeptidase-like regulatory domain-containing protein [Terriglobales bacterium]
MYKVVGILVVILVALSCSAQLTLPLSGDSPSTDNDHKSTRVTTRTLTGMVLDKSDKPVANAVVYLKNTKTLAVKTYIAQNDGTYRFPALSPNVDYDVYAEKDGKKSGTKTLSQFDDRPKPNINLRIDTGKAGK